MEHELTLHLKRPRPVDPLEADTNSEGPTIQRPLNAGKVGKNVKQVTGKVSADFRECGFSSEC